jgi:hypothetical protein
VFTKEKLDEIGARLEDSFRKSLGDALHMRLSFKNMSMNNHKTPETM